MPPAALPPAGYRRDIEGLRGLAVLAVVLGHAGVPLLRGGFVAVDVFFVLSGYFLTARMAKDIAAEGRIDLAALYGSRLTRLVPSLLLVLFTTLVLSWWLVAPIDRVRIAEDMRLAATFVSNIGFAARGVNYFSAGEHPLLHTWSLGVEMQVVLLWPLLLSALLWLGGRRRAPTDTAASAHALRLAQMQTMLWALIATGAVSFIVSYLSSRTSPMWAYYGPHTRFWAFAAGGLTALVTSAPRSVPATPQRRVELLRLAALVLIGGTALLYDRTTVYPGVAAVLPVLGAVLLLAGGHMGTHGVSGRLLGSAPLVAAGRVSYAWYLWHWPLMVLMTAIWPTWGVTARLVVGGGAGFVLAWLTTTWLERPLREPLRESLDERTMADDTTSASRTSPSRPAITPLIAIAGCATVLLLAQLMTTSFARGITRGDQARFAAARDDHMSHRCWAGRGAPRSAEACAFGNVNAPTTVALLGDSHAEHWLGGLDAAGRARGWRIDARVMGGCPVSALGLQEYGVNDRRTRECVAWRERAVRELIARRPAAVILSSFDRYVPARGEWAEPYQVRGDQWRAGLRRTYARFAAAGITVIVLRGTPQVPFDVPACLSRQAARLPFAQACRFVPDARFMRDAQARQDAAARGLPVHFVDMNDVVCDASPCAVQRNGLIRFTDDNHLTASFTRSLGGVLAQRIAPLLTSR
jgi:peptidoglycan/LPS O-acetylase OafA/YrhL